MEPISEFVDQLFLSAGAEPQRIVTFSCDHVIPKENIMTRIVTRGPTGVSLEFNYQNRQNPELVIINRCNYRRFYGQRYMNNTTIIQLVRFSWMNWVGLCRTSATSCQEEL